MIQAESLAFIKLSDQYLIFPEFFHIQPNVNYSRIYGKV